MSASDTMETTVRGAVVSVKEAAVVVVVVVSSVGTARYRTGD